MKTVYDEWTPLKKVLIGKSYEIHDDKIDEELKTKILFNYDEEISNRYEKYNVFRHNSTKAFRTHHLDTEIQSLFDIFDQPSIEALKKVHNESNEDLDALADICKAYGAEVVRPTLKYGVESTLEHPMQCRDTIGKIGNTVFEINTPSDNRRIENYNHRDVMLDEFEQGSRFISMPPAIYQNNIKESNEDINIDDINLRNQVSFDLVKEYDSQRQIIGDTAGIYKCGKHIFHTHANPQKRLNIFEHSRVCITRNGIEWYKREFPEHIFVPFNAYGHVDGKFAILRPGLVLTWAERFVPQIMRDHNWDIILMEEAPNFDGKTIKQLCEERGIKKYPLEHLLGVSQETRFDANCLSLDENTVITSGYDKNLADKLKKYNIEMIPWVNRWNVLWAGGAHCCSVDLERAGNLVDYFS